MWTYTPKRKKGRCPKLDSHWVGPCLVLERLGEVVYWVQMPGRGRRVALHRDRLAPYRGTASPQTAGGGGETPLMPVVASPNQEVVADSPGDSASACSLPPVVLEPPDQRHTGGQQNDTTPVGRLRLKDFVLGDEDLRKGGGGG